MVGLEQYLYGVVPSEMPFTWLPEALKAQAVVARSYALATRRTGAFDLYPDTRSQVYLGIETRSRRRSRGQCDRRPGRAVRGRSREDILLLLLRRTHGIGGGRLGEPVPYLVSVADYDSISPHHDWGPLVFTGTKLAKVLKMKGRRVVDLPSELNSSGRVKVLNVVGTEAVRRARCRRPPATRGSSTWYSIGVLSLAAPSQPVTFGGRGKLAGLARGMNQTVLQSLQGDTWTEMATLEADEDGVVTALVKPTVTTRYRLSMGKVNTAGRPRAQGTRSRVLSGTNPRPAPAATFTVSLAGERS